MGKMVRVRNWKSGVVALSLSLGSQAMAMQNFNVIRDQWQLEAVQQGFFTSQNYDGDGSVVNLPASHNYKHFLFELSGSYNLTDEISLLAGAGGANAQSSDGSYLRNTTAPTDASLAIQYLYVNRWVWLAPQLRFTNPLTTYDQTTDQALVNEGVYQVTGEINWLKMWNRKIQSFGLVGFTYQTGGRASLVPYRLATRLRVVRPWIGLEISGYKSVRGDDHAPSYRQAVTNRVDAGSLRFNSTNPNLVVAAGFVEFPFSQQWVARLTGGSTVAGANTAVGQYYQLALNYTFAGSAEAQDYFHITNQYRRQREREQQRLRRFHVPSERQDPTLFPEEVD